LAATFTAPVTPHDDAPDAPLTPGEVDEWLRLFGGEPDDE
jgi:hypothetical protein